MGDNSLLPINVLAGYKASHVTITFHWATPTHYLIKIPSTNMYVLFTQLHSLLINSYDNHHDLSHNIILKPCDACRHLAREFRSSRMKFHIFHVMVHTPHSRINSMDLVNRHISFPCEILLAF